MYGLIPFELYNQALGLKTDLRSEKLRGMLSYFLPYALTIAGLILFVMLILGGFTMLTGMGNAEKQEKGKNQITSAFIGFIIIFAIYWIAQILQVIFQINIVN